MERFNYLFEVYIAKTATVDERLEFQEMLMQEQYDSKLKMLIDTHFENFTATDVEPDLAALDKVLERIAVEENIQQPIRISLWKQWSKPVAAAVLAFIVFGTYYINTQYNKQRDIDYLETARDIPPGRVGATLTLSDGRQIQLSDKPQGEIATQGAARIVKTIDGKLVYELNGSSTSQKITTYNTLTTAKAQTYALVLPDGSRVWMNAESSLTYASNLLDKGIRKVKLTGEAYFEIEKDKTHPFIVQSQGQEVEVLGTHFNISAYDDDHRIETTLLEGSIKLRSEGEGVSEVLKPGQQAVISGGTLHMGRGISEEVLDWKNGYFLFNNAPIDQVMTNISRWYDIEVSYEHGIPDTHFTGVISRDKSIIEFLRLLQKTKDIHFKVEGRRVIVME